MDIIDILQDILWHLDLKGKVGSCCGRLLVWIFILALTTISVILISEEKVLFAIITILVDLILIIMLIFEMRNIYKKKE